MAIKAKCFFPSCNFDRACTALHVRLRHTIGFALSYQSPEKYFGCPSTVQKVKEMGIADPQNGI